MHETCAHPQWTLTPKQHNPQSISSCFSHVHFLICHIFINQSFHDEHYSIQDLCHVSNNTRSSQYWYQTSSHMRHTSMLSRKYSWIRKTVPLRLHIIEALKSWTTQMMKKSLNNLLDSSSHSRVNDGWMRWHWQLLMKRSMTLTFTPSTNQNTPPFSLSTIIQHALAQGHSAIVPAFIFRRCVVGTLSVNKQTEVHNFDYEKKREGNRFSVPVMGSWFVTWKSRKNNTFSFQKYNEHERN